MVPTHISHRWTEVDATAGVRVPLSGQHVFHVELVQDADQCSPVPVVCHPSSIVALSCQVPQGRKLHILPCTENNQDGIHNHLHHSDTLHYTSIVLV